MRSWNMFLIGTIVAGLTVAQAALADTRLVVECSTRGNGPGNFHSGVQIVASARGGDYEPLRGKITDNYVSGDVVCRAERKTGELLCAGLWNLWDTSEPVLMRVRKAEGRLNYLLDISNRPKVHGGKPVASVLCEG